MSASVIIFLMICVFINILVWMKRHVKDLSITRILYKQKIFITTEYDQELLDIMEKLKEVIDIKEGSIVT